MGSIRVAVRSAHGGFLEGRVTVRARPLPGARGIQLSGGDVVADRPILDDLGQPTEVQVIPHAAGWYYQVAVRTDEGTFVAGVLMEEDRAYDIGDMPRVDPTVPWDSQAGES